MPGGSGSGVAGGVGAGHDAEAGRPRHRWRRGRDGGSRPGRDWASTPLGPPQGWPQSLQVRGVDLRLLTEPVELAARAL